MREILFRGKYQGEWVYGSFASAPRKAIIYEISESVPTRMEGKHVDIKTVGQYTGLTDKNGKKIFEGDIINIEYPDTIIHNAFVNYIGASFYGDNDFDLWELDTYVSLEVIGNIHDNPELSKGE